MVAGRERGFGAGKISRSGLLSLLCGGLLKGETLLLSFGGVTLAGKPELTAFGTNGLLVIRGFSERLTGGGGPIDIFVDESRRSSLDRRGGGGSGA